MYNAPQIDFLGIFQAAMAAKDRKEQLAQSKLFQDAQMKRWTLEQEQIDKKASLEANRQKRFTELNTLGVETGNWKPMQLEFPDRYNEMATARAAQQKSEQDALAGKQKLAEERAATTSRFYDQIMAMVQKNPENAARWQETVNARAKAGDINHFWVPTPEEIEVGRAGEEQALLAGTQKPEQYDAMDPAARLVINESEGKIRPNSPGWGPAYAKARDKLAKEELARAAAMGGQKTLPTSTVGEIADAKTAEQAVDELFDAFEQSIPSEGIIDTTRARIAAKVPNTTESSYQNQANVTTQVVGTFLEGGKLAEADSGRYRAMMPQPGDTLETAQAKKQALKSLIRKRAEGRKEALGDAGYKVPGAGKKSPQPAQSKEQLLQDLEKRKGSLDPRVYEQTKADIMAREK